MSLGVCLLPACTDESPATSDASTTGGVEPEAAPEAEWSYSHGGAAHGRDEALAVAVDATGRIVVAGFESDDDGRFNMLLLALSPDGEELWRRRIDPGPGLSSMLKDVVVDDEGNIFAAGWDARRFGTVRRFDRDGRDVWTYLAPDEGSSVSALALANEGLYSLGEESGDRQAPQLVLRRHALASGDPAWTSKPGGLPPSVRGHGLAVAGERLVVAGTAVVDDDLDRPLTAAFSLDGALDSFTFADGSGTWHAAAALADGDVVVTGALGRKGAAQRLSPAGEVRWTQQLAPADFAFGGLGVAVGPEDSLVIAGSHGDNRSPPREDVYMARLRSDGAPLWTALYNNAELSLADRGYDVAFGPGFFVVVGFETAGVNDTDIWVRRFPAD